MISNWTVWHNTAWPINPCAFCEPTRRACVGRAFIPCILFDTEDKSTHSRRVDDCPPTRRLRSCIEHTAASTLRPLLCLSYLARADNLWFRMKHSDQSSNQVSSHTDRWIEVIQNDNCRPGKR